MKTRNSFSKLRLMSVLAGFTAFIAIMIGFANQDGTAITVAIIAFFALLVIRLIRFMYRD